MISYKPLSDIKERFIIIVDVLSLTMNRFITNYEKTKNIDTIKHCGKESLNIIIDNLKQSLDFSSVKNIIFIFDGESPEAKRALYSSTQRASRNLPLELKKAGIAAFLDEITKNIYR